MLRCTRCHETFQLQKEFDKCPECKIGILIGGLFSITDKPTISSAIDELHENLQKEAKRRERVRKMRKQLEAMEQALDSFKINYEHYEEAGLDPDDLFDSGYVDEQDKMLDHSNCSCINEPYPHLDFLTIGDLNTHEFMCYTLDSIDEENPKQICSKMGERFTRTFEVGAKVLAGQRNS